MNICECCHNAAIQYGVIVSGVEVARICGECRYGGAILPANATFTWVSPRKETSKEDAPPHS